MLSHLLISKTRSHIGTASLAELFRVLPPQPSGLNIGGAFIVRAAKHADDAEEDRFRGLHWRPALRGRFVAVLVLFGWMKDGDAHVAVLIDCEQN